MSATAQEGRAAVVVQFKLDTNLDFAAIDVQRRVDTARVFMPTDLDPPLVEKSAGVAAVADPDARARFEDALSGTGALRSGRPAHRARHQAHSERQSVDTSGAVKREFHV